MKFRGLLFAVAVLAGSPAHATDAGHELAQRSVCLACHQVDAKRVGPSFRSIALRYAGNDAAAEYLARTIRSGSRGLWGAIPMPAQSHVDPATALLLGEWILSLAPESDRAKSGRDTPATAAGDAGNGHASQQGTDVNNSSASGDPS